MPTFDTLYDAFCYTLVGILFAVITMRVRRDLRAGSAQMIVLLLVGLLMLTALYKFGGGLAGSSLEQGSPRSPSSRLRRSSGARSRCPWPMSCCSASRCSCPRR